MAGVLIHRTPVARDWIDYNGHLRDAYYGLIVSYATDALMDRLGMDAAYRQRTHCTLYTLESHTHYLRELKQADVVSVTVRLLAADHKRIHAAFDVLTEGQPEPAACAESMLLHVHQGDKVAAQAFPEEIAASITALLATTASLPAAGPGSRRIELRSR